MITSRHYAELLETPAPETEKDTLLFYFGAILLFVVYLPPLLANAAQTDDYTLALQPKNLLHFNLWTAASGRLVTGYIHNLISYLAAVPWHYTIGVRLISLVSILLFYRIGVQALKPVLSYRGAALTMFVVALTPPVQVAMNWGAAYFTATALPFAVSSFIFGMRFMSRGTIRNFVWATLLSLLALNCHQMAAMSYAAFFAPFVLLREDDGELKTVFISVRNFLAPLVAACILNFAEIKIIRWLFASYRFERDKLLDIQALDAKVQHLWVNVLPMLGGIQLFADNLILTYSISLVVIGIILVGVAWFSGWSGRLPIKLVCLAGLYFACYLPGLATANNIMGMRMIVALIFMSTLLFCCVLWKLGSVYLTSCFRKRWARWLVTALLAVNVMAVSANSLRYFIIPLKKEYAFVKNELRRLLLAKPTAGKIYVHQFRPWNTLAPALYQDEFGGMSTLARWSAKDMVFWVLIEDGLRNGKTKKDSEGDRFRYGDVIVLEHGSKPPADVDPSTYVFLDYRNMIYSK